MIRWLRPEFQNPAGKKSGIGAQQALELPVAAGKRKVESRRGKMAWPKALPEQFKALRGVLAESGKAVSAKEVAARFKKARVAVVEELLETLVSLSQAHKSGGGYMG